MARFHRILWMTTERKPENSILFFAPLWIFSFFFLPRKAQKNKIKAENDVIDILDFEVHHLAPEVVLDVLDSRLSSVIDQFRKIKIQP